MIERPRFRTKQELVYLALREGIMTCELQPGERLIIDDISRRLGVSHIPVREAIQQLQSEGLVFVVPHTGTTVAPVSRESLREIFVLMEGFELVSMEIAAAQLDSEGFRHLDHLLAEMDQAVDAGDVERWSVLNAEFHRTIAAATRMPMLMEMLGRTLNHWDRVRRYFGISSGRLTKAQAEHHEIVQALRVNDRDRLHILARQHSRLALEAYTKELDSASSRDSTAAHDNATSVVHDRSTGGTA